MTPQRDIEALAGGLGHRPEQKHTKVGRRHQIEGLQKQVDALASRGHGIHHEHPSRLGVGHGKELAARGEARLGVALQDGQILFIESRGDGLQFRRVLAEHIFEATSMDWRLGLSQKPSARKHNGIRKNDARFEEVHAAVKFQTIR